MDRHERARAAAPGAARPSARRLDEGARGSRSWPNSGLYTALLAPIGSGLPTCAITTPISPAGTCTHGNFFTPKSGHSLKRSPGISMSAW